MANRRRHSRGTNQFVADETDELSRLSVQHFYERSTGLHIRHVAADRADLYLFPALHRAARSSDDLCLCEHLDGYGGVDAIFHHLLARDDGLLDSRNFDNRFHRLLVRILLRRPNVSDRHHAQRGAGRDEMAAVLLRIVLPRRDFPRPTTRRSTRGSAGNSNRLALPHLGRRARDVGTRPRPLSGRGGLARTRSATAGEGECSLQWTCFHKAKRGSTPASGWLHRLVRCHSSTRILRTTSDSRTRTCLLSPGSPYSCE